jgi:hypothetical protein
MPKPPDPEDIIFDDNSSSTQSAELKESEEKAD